MTDKKIITVFGATGSQGGSVADKFLSDPKLKDSWTLRAVTRDVTKESAKKLASRGAEVVAADMGDKAAVLEAMKGATAVYAVTNYWDTLDKNLEIQQGKNMADAAKEAGVQHYIWSSLPNVTKLSNGILPNVYHFDGKADVEEYVRELGIPATFFMAGFYMENLPGKTLHPTEDGKSWTIGPMPIPPTAQVPMFGAVHDTGKFVKAIILNGNKVLGKRILGATEYMTGQQILDGFKKLYPEAGANATFVQVPHEAFVDGMKAGGTPEFVAREVLENMRLMHEFGYFGGENLNESLAIVTDDKLSTWEEHMKSSPVFANLK